MSNSNNQGSSKPASQPIPIPKPKTKEPDHQGRPPIKNPKSGPASFSINPKEDFFSASDENDNLKSPKNFTAKEDSKASGNRPDKHQKEMSY